MLVVDIDQRAIAVRGTKFELAKGGYFGRKRGRRGYQLSVMFLGGKIGEVIDEYLDPGDISIERRLNDLLQSLKKFCHRLNIKPQQVLLRADAQLGTAVIIKQVKSAGFHYLFKGLSSARAVNLVKQATNTFWRVKPVNQRDVRWVSDLGVIEHLDRSNKGDGSAIETRTVVMTQVKQVEPPKPGAHRKRVGDKQVVINNYYYLTDLNNQQLSIADLLDTYDDRATIERYFYDEQYALGAQQV